MDIFEEYKSAILWNVLNLPLSNIFSWLGSGNAFWAGVCVGVCVHARTCLVTQ